MAMNKTQIQLQKLILLLQLQQRVRWVSVQEQRFAIVNETLQLIPYEQALLWETSPHSKAAITAISAVTIPEQDTPALRWMSHYIKNHLYDLTEPTIIHHTDEKEWTDYFAPYFYVIPLQAKGYHWHGLLILTRNETWNDAEQTIVPYLADAYAHALAKERSHTHVPFYKKILSSRKKRVIAVALLVIGLLPLRLSVIAPAEVIAQQPMLIRASMNGVIEEVLVSPGQQVKQGDVLARFDIDELNSRIDVAQKTLDAATLDHRQMLQAGMDDATARLKIVSAAGAMKQAKSELAYITSLKKRAEITAPQDGAVIFEDAYDWQGRAVTMGERIMLLANPSDTQLEVRLPVHDAIHLGNNTEIDFFSNVAPHRPNHAQMTHHSYRAYEDEAGAMSYRIHAAWEDAQQPTLGMKGNAKLYGKRTPLIMHILRKPLTTLRQWMGI